MHRFLVAPALCLMLLSWACIEEPRQLIKPVPDTSEHEVFVYKKLIKDADKAYVEPTHDLAARIMRIQKRFVPKATIVSELIEGNLEEGQTIAYRFMILGPHTDGSPRCYHFFAVAEDDSVDLDMEIFNHKNARMSFDNQIDFYPLIRYICPPHGIKGYVLLRMTRGSSRFGLRIFQYDGLELNPEALFNEL